jgi:hypothetical protein
MAKRDVKSKKETRRVAHSTTPRTPATVSASFPNIPFMGAMSIAKDITSLHVN